jgi:hypothetical protein
MQNAEAQGAPPVEICGTAGGNFTGSINETYTGGDCNIFNLSRRWYASVIS